MSSGGASHHVQFADDTYTHQQDAHLQLHVCDKLYAGSGSVSGSLPASASASAPTGMGDHDKDQLIDFEMMEYYASLPKAIYVTTGAVVPPHCNAVIPVEDVAVMADHDDSDHDHDNDHDPIPTVISIHISKLATIQRNAWIRPIGCDIRPNATIVERGEVIEPVHMGLLVQCGIKEVKVAPLPCVGVWSTGNELNSMDGDGDTSGEERQRQRQRQEEVQEMEGFIPDANGPILCSLLASYGNCRPNHLGIVKDDDEDRLTKVLKETLNQYDVVVTTGGVSMGEMDVIEKVLVNNLGCEVHFGRLVSAVLWCRTLALHAWTMTRVPFMFCCGTLQCKYKSPEISPCPSIHSSFLIHSHHVSI